VLKDQQIKASCTALRALRAIVSKKKIFELLPGIDELSGNLSQLQALRTLVTKTRKTAEYQTLKTAYGSLGSAVIDHLGCTFPSSWVKKYCVDFAEAVLATAKSKRTSQLNEVASLLSKIAMGDTSQDVGGTVCDCVFPSRLADVTAGSALQMTEGTTDMEFLLARRYVLGRVTEKIMKMTDNQAQERFFIFTDEVQARIVELNNDECLKVAWAKLFRFRNWEVQSVESLETVPVEGDESETNQVWSLFTNALRSPVAKKIITTLFKKKTREDLDSTAEPKVEVVRQKMLELGGVCFESVLAEEGSQFEASLEKHFTGWVVLHTLISGMAEIHSQESKWHAEYLEASSLVTSFAEGVLKVFLYSAKRSILHAWANPNDGTEDGDDSDAEGTSNVFKPEVLKQFAKVCCRLAQQIETCASSKLNGMILAQHVKAMGSFSHSCCVACGYAPNAIEASKLKIALSEVGLGLYSRPAAAVFTAIVGIADELDGAKIKRFRDMVVVKNDEMKEDRYNLLHCEFEGFGVGSLTETSTLEEVKNGLAKCEQVCRDMEATKASDARLTNAKLATRRLAALSAKLGGLTPVEEVLLKHSSAAPVGDFDSMTIDELTSYLTEQRLGDLSAAYKDYSDAIKTAKGPSASLLAARVKVIVQMASKSALIAIEKKICAAEFEETKLKPRSISLLDLPASVREAFAADVNADE
jgi:hypothetical protein